MNEKIVELLTKEGFLDSDGDPVTDFKTRHLVDLIETVVRECSDLFEVEWGEGKLTGNDVGYVVKKHFGVEE